MYKTILAPMDRSKCAEAILPHLEQLAGRYKAKVIFLQAVEQSMFEHREKMLWISIRAPKATGAVMLCTLIFGSR